VLGQPLSDRLRVAKVAGERCPRKATAVVIMMAAAPMTTTKAPTTVSVRSYAIQRGVMRLSTTFDCWKKSCHGATVVPRWRR